MIGSGTLRDRRQFASALFDRATLSADANEVLQEFLDNFNPDIPRGGLAPARLRDDGDATAAAVAELEEAWLIIHTSTLEDPTGATIRKRYELTAAGEKLKDTRSPGKES